MRLNILRDLRFPIEIQALSLDPELYNTISCYHISYINNNNNTTALLMKLIRDFTPLSKFLSYYTIEYRGQN